MTARAREQYRDIAFILCDALDLPFENEFDLAFFRHPQ